MNVGSRVRGLTSGSIGFVADVANNSGERSISQTTGAFIEGEQIIIDEKPIKFTPSIISLVAYTVDDIKSVYQSKLIAFTSINFSADTVLYDRVLPYFSLADNLSV